MRESGHPHWQVLSVPRQVTDGVPFAVFDAGVRSVGSCYTANIFITYQDSTHYLALTFHISLFDNIHTRFLITLKASFIDHKCFHSN